MQLYVGRAGVLAARGLMRPPTTGLLQPLDARDSTRPAGVRESSAEMSTNDSRPLPICRCPVIGGVTALVPEFVSPFDHALTTRS